MLASWEIPQRTFPRVAALGYGNDGETGTYKTDELSEAGIRRSVAGIVRKWLVNTGLMYCGVRR